jgi:hypothetical protein
MSKKRLSGTNKETILRRIIAHAFDAEKRQLGAEFLKLAEDAYQTVYSKEAHYAFKTLPKGSFFTQGAISITFEGNGGFVRLDLAEGKPCFYEKRNSSHIIPADNPLGPRYLGLKNRREALQEAEDKARAEAWAILTKATTVEGLLEMWPEVVSFTAGIFAPTADLPMVQIGQLNSALKLPPKN